MNAVNAVAPTARSVSLSVMVFARVLLGVAGAATTLCASPNLVMALGASTTRVILVLDGAPVKLDAEALRGAIASELGITVTLSSAGSPGDPSLVLRSDFDGRVTLTYHADKEHSIGRSIDLPEDPRRATEMLALLAGNLMRDEAAELVASLGKGPETPANETPANEKPPEPAAAAPETITPKSSAMERHAKPSVPPSKPLALATVVRKREARPTAACAVRPGDVVTFGGDVIPFVGTSMMTGTDVIRHYSVNFLGGYIEGLSGVEAGVGVNVETSFMCGFQVANVANVVAGPARGVQLAGGVNVASSVKGVQIAGVNVSAGPLAGVQLGAASIVVKTATGVQAGALNIVAGDMVGVQLGVANVATGNVRGMQLGLVNVADRTAFSLGLLNIIRHGRTHLDLWALESGIVMLGLKHGSNYVHNIYGAGIHTDGASVHATFSLGLGGRIPISDRWYADIDAIGYSLHKPSLVEVRTLMIQARTVVGVRLAPRFAVYGGPSYNVAYAPIAENSVLSPYGSTVLSNGVDGPVRGWLGGVLGIQVF